MSRELNHPYVVIDVFTDTALQGNPLAVFTEGEEVPSRLMQAAARELNLSETVFLMPGDDGADAQLRIFTPQVELPFAGHPVLGAAFIVAERDELSSVRLRTQTGIVPVHLTREDGQIVYGEMEQPIPTVSDYADTDALLEALRVAQAALPVQEYSNGPLSLFVCLASAEEVAALTPDLGALAAVAPEHTVSCFALTGDAEVKSRVFAPGAGVPEDPATGSAAGPLALHLARHGLTSFGQTVTITQGVEIGRRSTLVARVEASEGVLTRVLVGGSAVRVAEGHFRLQ